MSQLYWEKARQKVFFCKARVYEHGEKAGKLLAYLAHVDEKPPVVVSPIGPDVTLLTDPLQVAKNFSTFTVPCISRRTDTRRKKFDRIYTQFNF